MIIKDKQPAALSRESKDEERGKNQEDFPHYSELL